MKKRKLLPVLLVLLLLLLAAGAALLFAGGGQDSGSGVDESVKPSPLLLQASQDRFRVYKGAQTELTVTSHEFDEGTVNITDELGETVLTLELKDGTATGTIGVFEESPRCIQLTASVGEAKSQPLNLYVAPEVTAEMIAVGAQVARDLGRELFEQGFTAVDMEAVEAAKIWLEADERVEATVSMDNGVFYYTTDGIAGACLLTPEEGMLGSTSFNQQENDELETYAAWETGGLSSYQYLWSDNTVTNDEILVLSPLYKEREEDKFGPEDPCFHNDSQSDMALEIAKARNSPMPEVYRDEYAVERLTSGIMNEYGIVMMNTHGTMLGPEGMDVNEQLWCYMLQTSNHFRGLDSAYDNMAEYLRNVLAIQSEDYDRFFTKYSINAVDNLETSQLFIAIDMGYMSAWFEELYDTTGDGPDVLTGVQIYGTSNMICSLYQNEMFDNSIIYFGICYSLANTKLAQFFVDHGAAAYVGYINAVNATVESATCRTFFRDMLSWSNGKVHYKTVKESCEGHSAGLIIVRNVIGIAHNAVNEAAKKESWVAKIFGWGDGNEINQFNLAAMADPEDYTFYGVGTLTGKVCLDQTGEPVGGALVELYRWLDQEFVLMSTTSTTGKGTFKVEDIPWGVYVAKVTTEEGAPAYANCILAAEEWAAGTILVEGMSPYYVYIRDELEPKLGLFELGEKSQSINDPGAQGWDTRTGILSAAIQDMNADGTDDMVLLRVELEDRKGWNLQTLYADMYTVVKGKVVLKDSVKLDVFNNCEIHDTWAAMYETESGYDLFVQSYSESVLFSGNDPIYSRYRFDGEALRKVFSIEQTEGGTTEKVYSEMKYDEQTDQETTMALWRDEMLWGWDGPGLYNSWGYKDSLSMYWAYLEEKMAMKAPGDVYDYPSYVGADKFTSVAEFKNDGVPVGGMGGDFSMSVMDYTDLRGALEELEKQ